MKNTKQTLHNDLKAFMKSGEVMDPEISDEAMEKNIGRLMTFVEKAGQGTSHRDTFRVGGIQRTHDGLLAYRVYSTNYDDTFGRAAVPEDVIWNNGPQ